MASLWTGLKQLADGYRSIFADMRAASAQLEEMTKELEKMDAKRGELSAQHRQTVQEYERQLAQLRHNPFEQQMAQQQQYLSATQKQDATLGEANATLQRLIERVATASPEELRRSGLHERMASIHDAVTAYQRAGGRAGTASPEIVAQVMELAQVELDGDRRTTEARVEGAEAAAEAEANTPASSSSSSSQR